MKYLLIWLFKLVVFVGLFVPMTLFAVWLTVFMWDAYYVNKADEMFDRFWYGD